MLYAALLAAAGAVLPITLLAWDGPVAALAGLAIAPLALRLNRVVATRTDGASLNAALAGTGLLVAGFSMLVSLGLLAAS